MRHAALLQLVVVPALDPNETPDTVEHSDVALFELHLTDDFGDGGKGMPLFEIEVAVVMTRRAQPAVADHHQGRVGRLRPPARAQRHVERPATFGAILEREFPRAARRGKTCGKRGNNCSGQRARSFQSPFRNPLVLPLSVHNSGHGFLLLMDGALRVKYETILDGNIPY